MRVRGEVSFKLAKELGLLETRVDIRIAFALSGALAQFSRSGIVNALADQLTQTFATNLGAMMKTIEDASQTLQEGSYSAAKLDMNILVFQAIWRRFRSMIMAGLKRLGL